ncbi:unnamed protein product, partial [Urochloa humidicola]
RGGTWSIRRYLRPLLGSISTPPPDDAAGPARCSSSPPRRILWPSSRSVAPFTVGPLLFYFSSPLAPDEHPDAAVRRPHAVLATRTRRPPPAGLAPPPAEEASHGHRTASKTCWPSKSPQAARPTMALNANDAIARYLAVGNPSNPPLLCWVDLSDCVVAPVPPTGSVLSTLADFGIRLKLHLQSSLWWHCP